MKKIAITMLALTLLAVFSGCGEKGPTEEGLRAMLEAKVSEQILDFKYDDYDGDGVFEAFAFVGEEQGLGEYKSYIGEIWFIGADGTEKLESNEHGYWGLINVYTFGKNKFAVLNKYAATGGYVSVWSVHSGGPRHENISNAGGGLKQIDDRNFTLWHSTYDFDVTDGIWTGHTWKDYWFYWDEQFETFKEYGGAKITETQLRRCNGAAAVLNAIQEEGDAIGDIFYRGNGIINVNHFRGYDESNRVNSHTILKLSGTRVTVLEMESNSGIYQSALAPDIAVYPELPGIFN